MDAYEISNQIKQLWVEHTPKNSGELSKKTDQITVHCSTPYGIWQISDVTFDENFGIMLNVRIKEYKEDGKD